MAFGTLLLLHPDGSRLTLNLEKTTIRIGRAADNDVVLAHPQVADYHAQILCDPTGVQVLDLGSSAGTAINDQPLEHYGLARFGFGQRLQVGPVWMLLYHEAELPAPEPPRSRWSWPPAWWLRWREQARARKAQAALVPPSAITPAAEASEPAPGLLQRVRSWHIPDWFKRIFIWSWLKQNGHRALAWLLGLVGFFWLRTFLSRWLGISPDLLNPMQLLDERKEPASQPKPQATPEAAPVSSTAAWHEPQRGTPPTPPTIPVRRSEQLHLAIDPAELATDPGRAVALTVTVVNRSPLVDRVSFLVDGLPQSWVSITPPALSLMPGDSGSSEIVIRPPRDANSVAGIHPFVVAARSSEETEPGAALAASLAITPFHDFRLDFQPQQRSAWRRGHYELRIINNSNQTQAFALQGRDEAQALWFDFQPVQPLVTPGQVAPVQVMVRRRRPHLLGKPISSGFHLLAEPTHRATPAQQVQGQLIQRAVSWSLLLLLLLLPIFLYSLSFAPYALSVVEATIKKEPVPTPSRDLFPPIPTGLPQLAGAWSSSAPTPLSNAAPLPVAASTTEPSTSATATAASGGSTTSGAAPNNSITAAAAPGSASSADTLLTGLVGGLLENPLVPTDQVAGETGAPNPLSIRAVGNQTPVPAISGPPLLGEPLILANDLLEGQASNPGYTIAELLAAFGYRTPAGEPGGLAVVGLAGGRWQYSTNGILWRDFPVQTSPANATLLLGNPVNRVRFVPQPDFNTELIEPSAIPQLQVLAWDGSQFQNAATGINTSTTGDTSPFGATTSTVIQRVEPVNDPPSFRLNLPSLVLTSTATLVIPNAVSDGRAGPANEQNQLLTYEIAVDPLCLTAVISDSGSLALRPRDNVLCAERVGSVVLRDDGGTANRGADRSQAYTFLYTVNTRNQQPAFQSRSASLDILVEDPTSNPGLPVSQALLRLGYYDQERDPGGLAVIAADTTNGQWQYQLDGGAWTNLLAPTRLAPLLLRTSPDNGLRFVPDPDYAGDATLTVLPWDSRSWDVASAFWANPAQLQQSIRPVNDPPSFQLSTTTLNVQTSDLMAVGLFANAIRPGPEDETGQQLAFAIELSGDVSSVFASAPVLASDGTLTLRALPNQQATVSARVTLRDNEQGVSTPATFTLAIDTLSTTTTAAAQASATAVVQTATAQTVATQVAATQTAAAQTAAAQTAIAQQTVAASQFQTALIQTTIAAATGTAQAYLWQTQVAFQTTLAQATIDAATARANATISAATVAAAQTANAFGTISAATASSVAATQTAYAIGTTQAQATTTAATAYAATSSAIAATATTQAQATNNAIATIAAFQTASAISATTTVAYGTAMAATASAQTWQTQAAAQTQAAVQTSSAIAATATTQAYLWQTQAAANTQVAVQTSSAVAAATATQATAYANATATAVAQPYSLQIITSPSSQTAGQPMTVEVAVVDMLGRVAITTGNDYIVSLQLRDGSGQVQSTFWPIAISQNGIATFTGLTFTKAGTYQLSAIAKVLIQSAPTSLQITPAAASQFAFVCFVPGGQTSCLSDPVVFTADQQFGFIARALDPYDNIDTNFWGGSSIKIGGNNNVPYDFPNTPSFNAGQLVFNTGGVPSQMVGDLFYSVQSLGSIPSMLTPAFTVVPGAPAMIDPVGESSVTLGPVDVTSFSVLVRDSRQNPVQGGVQVCFKTDAFSDGPDLTFYFSSKSYIAGRSGIKSTTNSSGIATSDNAGADSGNGSYTLYAYTQPDGSCISDLPLPPGPPSIAYPFSITNWSPTSCIPGNDQTPAPCNVVVPGPYRKPVNLNSQPTQIPHLLSAEGEGKPSTLIKSASSWAASNASGIIMSNSMARIALAATAVTTATGAGPRPPNTR